jgi:orotidine-5'-phosphate decarboxylase
MLNPQDIANRTIIALDYSSAADCEQFFKKIYNLETPQLKTPRYVKVGLELFYADGKRVLSLVRDRGLKLFLDLKLHDIPNTVYGGIRNLAKYQPEIINVHASGGTEMMQAAKRALVDAGASQTKLIAVTVLTSLDDNWLSSIGIKATSSELAVNLALRTKEAGLDGIVCSPHEAAQIKSVCGAEFLTVCPGVRPVGSESHDQKRISTPRAALEGGADYIVMGRAITGAEDPFSAFS